MSEYQYYEFLAIDHPLSRKQIDEVRNFSTRAEITPTSFVNEYHWGDFRGNPDVMVSKYFDLMYYYANWGSRRLLIGLPADGIDAGAWKIYRSTDIVEIRKSGQRLLIDFNSSSEDYDGEYMEEGGGLMASLAPVRSEILGGDLRPLYLGWLAGVYDEKTGEVAPPTPPGLDDLTSAQIALADFLRVDDDLLEAAARRSQPATPPKLPLKQWIAQLPLAQKDRLLFDAASGEGMRVGTKLMQQYSRSQLPAGEKLQGPPVRELLEYAGQIREKRETEERLAAEARRARKAAQEAADREKFLKNLAPREPQVWSEVGRLLSMKQANAYKSAILQLRDLRDLAVRKDAVAAFASRVAQLREAHAAKHSFIKQLNAAQL